VDHEATLDIIESLQLGIEGDLDAFEDGDELFVHLKYDKEAGALLMPICWIEVYLPKYQERWYKFMYGQTYLLAGYWPRDVLRFLSSLEQRLQSER
jgi:hypothetical protein